MPTDHTSFFHPWARHFTPRKYWLITQEAVAPSRHDWKIVDWDVKPHHKQTNLVFTELKHPNIYFGLNKRLVENFADQASVTPLG